MFTVFSILIKINLVVLDDKETFKLADAWQLTPGQDLKAFRSLMIAMKQVRGFYFSKMKQTVKFPLTISLVDYKTGTIPRDPCISASCQNAECIYDIETIYQLLQEARRTCLSCGNKINFDDVFYDSSLADIAQKITKLEGKSEQKDHTAVTFYSNHDWVSTVDDSVKGRIDTSSTILLQLSSLTIENILKSGGQNHRNVDSTKEKKKSYDQEASESDSSGKI